MKLTDFTVETDSDTLHDAIKEATGVDTGSMSLTATLYHLVTEGTDSLEKAQATLLAAVGVLAIKRGNS